MRIRAALVAATVLAGMTACSASGGATNRAVRHGGIEPPQTAQTTAQTAPSTALTLIVSDQSYNEPSVGIVVTIDGASIVDQVFAVGNQHNNKTFQVAL